ncbi:porin family protein [Hymenobacter sp. BT770]|uniref:porin family protein n=1 Tax=Hymenobacter sp. BT770 TaxID=2886942 RepID=UPI001D1300E1|nr:porin family protein [Hymenobacter sp. BT770]MCC3154837.1 PorT family protein [Hymenobacter sp. BT770]MDO3416788.1 porin family protein [Hymenobacter sp. BT770]
MKKTFFTLALLAGLAGAAQAQRSDISLGLKAGASLTNFVGADAGKYSYTSTYGLHAGVFANVGLSNMVALQPEVLYSQKGAKYPALLGDDIKRRLHYIDVPVLLHVNADGLFFEAGPQVGFLLKAQDQHGSTTTALDRKEYNTVDFGYVAGLGYQKKSGPGIGLRYNGALTNTRPDETTGNTTYQTRLHNSAFQLYLTYSFNGR